ncbi:hypothetical protein [Nocardioides korecus]
MAGRDAEPSVTRALVVLADGEGGPAGGGGLFGLQQPAFDLLGLVGADHLQQVTTQGAEGGGVVVRGLADQPVLGLEPLLGGDGEVAGGGEEVEAGEDRAGLVGVDAAGGDGVVQWPVGF